MPPKHIVIFISSFFFYCQYFEDISPPTNLPTETPLEIKGAKEFFKNQDSFSLYQKQGKKQIRIKQIFFLNRPISRKDEFIPKVVNFFHWTTEKSILENEILFAPNSETTLEDIAESERLLRQLISVKEAKIYLKASDEANTFDAYVYAEDRVTSTVNSNIEFSGGYSRVLLSIGDLNFFGRLVEMSAIYDRENFINTYGIDIGQARLFASPFELRAFFRESFVEPTSTFSLGGQRNYTYQKIIFVKDFRSIQDRYAFFAGLEHARGVQYRFVGGSIEQVLDRQNNRKLEMVLGRDLLAYNIDFWRAFGRLDRLELGLGFGQDKDKHFFTLRSEQETINPRPISGISQAAEQEFLPVIENGRFIKFGLNLKSIEFITRKNFQKFSFTEDLFRGWVLTNKFRFANDKFGLPDFYTEFDVKLRYVYDQKKIRNDASVQRTARKLHSNSQLYINDFIVLDNRFFFFTNHGTYGFLTNIKRGFNLDRDNKFEFGGDYVRGFAKRSRVGDLAYLVSFEFRTLPIRIRPWLIKYISKYFLFGAVVFLDIGEVKTNYNGNLKSLSPEPVLGVGFRSSAVEFDNNLFRFDFGIPLRSDSFALANQVSFGLEHTF